MQCIVRSADQTWFEGAADRVVARSPYGEFAVMNEHAPLVSVLAAGLIRIQSSDEEHRIVCKSGTFEVTDNVATLLVERPIRLDAIDVAEIKTQLDTLTNQPPAEQDAEEISYLQLLCSVKENHG